MAVVGKQNVNISITVKLSKWSPLGLNKSDQFRQVVNLERFNMLINRGDGTVKGGQFKEGGQFIGAV